MEKINPRTARAGDRVWDAYNGEVELVNKPRRIPGGWAVDIRVPQSRIDDGTWTCSVTWWNGCCSNLYVLPPPW